MKEANRRSSTATSVRRVNRPLQAEHTSYQHLTGKIRRIAVLRNPRNRQPVHVLRGRTALNRMSDHTNLISYINRKDWWHVPPEDPTAYQKRGMFLSSTFRQAEFYGRP